MKRSFHYFLFLFSLSAQAATIKIGNGIVDLQLIAKEKAEVQVEIRKDGKLAQAFENMGGAFEKIEFAGKSRNMLAVDFDKDGFEEIILRTTMPPLVGALWVFQWDKEKKLYAHALNFRGDRYIPVPLSGPVEIAGNGDLVFQQAGSGEKITYRWNGRGYVQK